MKQRLRSLSLATLAAVLLAGSLSACAPLLVGGAVGGALMASDRRTSGAQIDDEAIELRAAARLREALGDNVHLNITSYNRQVLLTGEVPSEAAKQRAEQIVAAVDNVRGIVNEVAVMPATSLVQRSNDVLITGKVRASFVDAQDLQANAFKVVTERGVVYLMGRVSDREAERATSIARGIGGVSKVVRIFEPANQADLQRAPAPAATVAPTPTAPASGAPFRTESGATVTPVR
ncbi:MAG: BON domain-containing protein [Ramlibacter sp.]